MGWNWHKRCTQPTPTFKIIRKGKQLWVKHVTYNDKSHKITHKNRKIKNEQKKIVCIKRKIENKVINQEALDHLPVNIKKLIISTIFLCIYIFWYELM